MSTCVHNSEKLSHLLLDHWERIGDEKIMEGRCTQCQFYMKNDMKINIFHCGCVEGLGWKKTKMDSSTSVGIEPTPTEPLTIDLNQLPKCWEKSNEEDESN